MVCTSGDLLEWKDFPKGLRVLLLNEDGSSAADMRSKLEEMDYIVVTFCNENEALSAISNKSESFHVAIVEVSPSNNDGIFKFLEAAKDLPTIMTSSIHSLSTMMKCIALGAVEFLQKPLSDDKLRNIWQHVVHKAFNAGGKEAFESLKPVKESVASMLQLQVEIGEKSDLEMSVGFDKYPAPSTPQRKQGLRLMDDGDCADQTNVSMDPESGEQEGETKSVETTYSNLLADSSTINSAHDTLGEVSPPEPLGETVLKEENECTNDQKSEPSTTPGVHNKDCRNRVASDATDPVKVSTMHNSSGTKANKKKSKVDWTPELHKKFVQAVEHLGVEQAIPSRILELMKVEGLTRHNVASHLQKYRMHRRQILPKEDERRWPNPSAQRRYYPHKPVMAFPPYHNNHVLPPGQVYPTWVPPNFYPNGIQMWGSPYYPGWQPSETWHWQPSETWHWQPQLGIHADAWGCPVMPQSPNACMPIVQNPAPVYRPNEMQNRYDALEKSFDIHPTEEVIDKVVKEAINKPWLPLPLGLKPPSTESVLNELSKQGISSIPPQVKGSNIH